MMAAFSLPYLITNLITITGSCETDFSKNSYYAQLFLQPLPVRIRILPELLSNTSKEV